MRTILHITLFLFIGLSAVSQRGCTFSTNPIAKGSKDTTGYGSSTNVCVLPFVNSASLAKATLPQTMAEALRDAIQSQTKMNLVPRGGDIVYEGTITGYSISPVAIQGANQTAALNRLTITISVKFTDTKKESNSFEASFSRFSDYSSSQNLSSVEDDLIKDITSQLVQDVLNRSLNSW